ncbi:hypothetical protein [Kosakonia phage Kc166B]|nr:hypothetical protein [Kosakonia phage Kc166B]
MNIELSRGEIMFIAKTDLVQGGDAAALAQMLLASQWVSCADRMPNLGEKVIVSAPWGSEKVRFGTPVSSHAFAAMKRINDKDYGQFYAVDGGPGCNCEVMFCDYWMPVPALPKGAK